MSVQDAPKVALLQLPANADDRDLLPEALEAMEQAVEGGAQLLILPELFRSPYFCQRMDPANFRYAESIPGETTDVLQRFCHQHQVVVVASLFEAVAPGLNYNTTVVIDADGTLLGSYRKTHIPDDPLYYEKFYFTPGDKGIQVFSTRYAQIGVLICWDQWYPEAARLATLQGAELLVYPTAIGTIEDEGPEEHARQLDAWQTVQRGHAIANGVHVVAVNRAGREDELTFWGNSFACGPQGEWLARCGFEAETATFTLEKRRSKEVREWWPFLRDRRIDLYGDLKKRWLANPKREALRFEEGE